LTPDTIKKGMEALEDIEQQIKLPSPDRNVIIAAVNRYYTIIPHNFGFLKPPIIDTYAMLQIEYDLLAMLSDAEITVSMLSGNNDLTNKYMSLKNDITPLKPDSDEWQRIRTYLNHTTQEGHPQILNIYKLNRHGEKEPFSQHDHIAYRKLLWHGSSVCVFAAILSGGLKIMPHAGGRVGAGLYFADMFEKSEQYLGYSEDNKALILLNEVVLGSIHHIQCDDPSLVRPPDGFDSVLAQGSVMPDPNMDYSDFSLSSSNHPVAIPQGLQIEVDDQSDFSHNEYLIYDQTQVSSKYLLMLKGGSSW